MNATAGRGNRPDSVRRDMQAPQSAKRLRTISLREQTCRFRALYSISAPCSRDARQLAYGSAPLGTISAGGFADFGNVNVAVSIGGNAVWRYKVNWRRTIIAPARKHIPVQVQNRNPGRPVLAIRWLHERKQRSALA